MAVRVSVEPEETLPKRERDQVVEDIHLFVELLNRLQRGDVRKLRHELARVVVLDEAHRSSAEERHPVTGERAASPTEQAQLGFRSLVQFFEARRHLLADALTAPQAAEVLGVSRQTPLNRVKENTLLAIRDRGAYRFPAWQFDPQGEDGVLSGLPDVLEALEPQQPFAKLVWLRRENPTLSRREPVELLRRHEIEPVIAAAHAAANLP
jgi:excisionase family DNA binding protein